MNIQYEDFEQFVLYRYSAGTCLEERTVERYFDPELSSHGVYRGASRERVQKWLLRMLDRGKLRMEGFRYFVR